jgi:putative PIN family toxin of toxin-antitoxin system
MRVVLDTNTLVSALLFGGTASRLVPWWQSGRITLLVSGPILEEYLRVLAYPKFRLAEEEVRGVIEEEVLPFTETVTKPRRVLVACRDPDDKKFLECAVGGRARYLINGDRDLRELRTYLRVTILSVGEFLDAVRS